MRSTQQTDIAMHGVLATFPGQQQLDLGLDFGVVAPPSHGTLEYNASTLEI